MARANMVGSNSTKFFEYDVFLNHRGPDTKEQFLVPLINKLQEAGIQQPFMDRQDVHHGENVFKAIEDALASARMHIAFFSQNYAHSTYCLSELHKMLVTGRPIITVFYDVEPEHVRRPRNMHGPYAEAFKIHDAREKPDVVENWVMALEKAAAIRGFVRANCGANDELLVENIVEEVVRLLSPSTLNVPPRWGQYDWSLHYKLPRRGQGTIFFTADTDKNLHITLSPEAGIVFPLYEIVIGWQQTWQHTDARSEIRKQIPERTVCSYTPVDLTDPLVEELHHFWICIDADTQLIYVGRGQHPCDEGAFIIFKDPSFLSNVQYFTFSSNYLAITYTGIKVERKTATVLGNHGQESSSRLWSCINTTQVLQQSLNVTFSEASNSVGDHTWLNAYKFPTKGRGIVCFTANAILTDIHIAISPKPQTMDPMYKIVIGGWGNTGCAIRRKAKGENMCLVRTVGVIKLGKPNQFWVSINVDTQLIHVGSGNQPNLASVVCIYKDPNFITGARYVSFLSWDTTAFYSNIYVASPSSSKLLLGSHEPLEVESCWGKYNWESGYKFLSEGRGILYFAAKASTDVYVAISSKEETMDPMYEVVIGGWGNTKTGIRRHSQGELLCCVNEGLCNAQNEENATHHFWVSLDKDTQLIQVGRGSQANLESVICMYKDPRFLGEAMYIAFSSWDTPITYSSITVSFRSANITTPIEASAIQTLLEMEVGASTVQDQSIQSADSVPETFKSANNILLENSDLKVMVLENCWGQYEWRQYFELPSMGRGVVYFAAETITDVHIAISPQPKTADPMYEIVIGGWNNSMSVVRRESHGHYVCCALAGSDDPPIKPGVNHYWVSIDASSKLVKFGFGMQPEVESSIICIYKDAYFINDARYFTFTNWNAPVVYSNISVGNISSPSNPVNPSFENLRISEALGCQQHDECGELVGWDVLSDSDEYQDLSTQTTSKEVNSQLMFTEDSVHFRNYATNFKIEDIF